MLRLGCVRGMGAPSPRSRRLRVLGMPLAGWAGEQELDAEIAEWAEVTLLEILTLVVGARVIPPVPVDGVWPVVRCPHDLGPGVLGTAAEAT